MPYIPLKARIPIGKGLHVLLDKCFSGRAATDGELNYMITRIVHWFLGDEPNYSKYNAAIGVLESAKLELYRRKVSEYEDQKIEENGDL